MAIVGLLVFNAYVARDILNANGTDLASLFRMSKVMASESSDVPKRGNWAYHTVSWSGTAYQVKVIAGLEVGKKKWVMSFNPSLHVKLGSDYKSLEINKWCDKCNKDNSPDYCMMSELCKITEAEFALFFSN